MKYYDILTNPKDSNVYRNDDFGLHTTPMGSNNSSVAFFYKHQIPSGLFTDIKLETIEADIQKGLAELKELM